MLQFLLLAFLASFVEVVRADGISKGGAIALTVILVIAFSCFVSCGFYYWLEKIYQLPPPNKGYEEAQSNETPAANDESPKEESPKEESIPVAEPADDKA
jgi:hypothetical protein